APTPRSGHAGRAGRLARPGRTRHPRLAGVGSYRDRRGRQPVTGEIVWTPVLDGTTNVERFMALHGITDFDELLAASTDDIEWFWDAAAQFLDVPFVRPYE